MDFGVLDVDIGSTPVKRKGRTQEWAEEGVKAGPTKPQVTGWGAWE